MLCLVITFPKAWFMCLRGERARLHESLSNLAVQISRSWRRRRMVTLMGISFQVRCHWGGFCNSNLLGNCWKPLLSHPAAEFLESDWHFFKRVPTNWHGWLALSLPNHSHSNRMLNLKGTSEFKQFQCLKVNFQKMKGKQRESDRTKVTTRWNL
jgi:hypothetical protein